MWSGLTNAAETWFTVLFATCCCTQYVVSVVYPRITQPGCQMGKPYAHCSGAVHQPTLFIWTMFSFGKHNIHVCSDTLSRTPEKAKWRRCSSKGRRKERRQQSILLQCFNLPTYSTFIHSWWSLVYLAVSLPGIVWETTRWLTDHNVATG